MEHIQFKREYELRNPLESFNNHKARCKKP